MGRNHRFTAAMLLLVIVALSLTSALTSAGKDLEMNASLITSIALSAPDPEKSGGLSDQTLSALSCIDQAVATNGTSACNLGYYCTNGSCQCRKAPTGISDCGNGGFTTVECYCATFSKEENAVQVGACIYGLPKCQSLINASKYGVSNQFYQDTVCKPLNRTGTLCGRCLPDHYPLAYSFNTNCIRCPHVRWNFNPVVLFSQGMSLSPIARSLLLFAWDDPAILIGTKTILSLYGVWNLDIFRPFYSGLCLGIGILPTLALDYAIAVYPLLLILLSYFLIVLYDRNYRVVTVVSRPFRVLISLFSKNLEVRSSVIDAFSAFFLLSSIKFLSVSFDLLVPSRVYYLYGDTYTSTFRLFYSADIEYFGSEHLPYAILAIVMFSAFFVLPVAILALYPFAFFQKFLNLFPVRWYILHTFVDSFQGCYKDGTEQGTRDCRWFSALYFSLRCFCLIVYGLIRSPSYFPLCSLFLMFFVLLLVVVQPYKGHFANHYKSNSAFIVLYATFYMVMSVANEIGNALSRQYLIFIVLIAILLLLVPLFCILVFTVCWVCSRCRCCSGLRRWRRGYVAVGDVDDAAADAYCDRVVNPQAYPSLPAGRLVNCSAMH